MNKTEATPVLTPKEFVQEYFDDIAAGRYSSAANRFASDATLWVAGEGHWPLGGVHDSAGVAKIYALLRDRFPEGLRVTVHEMTAEENRVAVEGESYGARRDGKIYNNRYCWLFIVGNGKILQRREYLDVLHANDLLCGPLSGE